MGILLHTSIYTTWLKHADVLYTQYINWALGSQARVRSGYCEEETPVLCYAHVVQEKETSVWNYL